VPSASSFKRSIEKLIDTKLTAKGWIGSADVYHRRLDEQRVIALSLFHGTRTRLQGVPGVLYMPRLVLIDLAIETTYDQFCSQTCSPLFPDAAGTVCVSPVWISMNSPSFFSPIPRMANEFSSGVANEFVDLNTWHEYTNRELTQYYFSNRKFPKTPEVLFTRFQLPHSTEKDENEINCEIDNMIEDMEIAYQWLSNTFNSFEFIVDFASKAIDINKAILFGPVWPIKIPFILLLAKRLEAAKTFAQFLDDLRWWQVFNADQTIATLRLNQLFDWFKASRELPSDKLNPTLNKQLERIQKTIHNERGGQPRSELLNSQLNYCSAVGFPNLTKRVDIPLFEKYLTVRKISVGNQK
jgi:hypothetical protein